MPITDSEAHRIPTEITPIFSTYLARYSFKKYPAEDYANYKRSFSALKPTDTEIHNSLVWKWGHFGKDNFPPKQKELIKKVHELWPEFAADQARKISQHTFAWWREKLPSTAYISAAYITHLVHHAEPLPIIDQHNFRAMNFYIKKARPSHTSNKVPNSWNDINDLKAFMSVVLKHLPERTFDEIDRFLMMYGRSIKPKRTKNKPNYSLRRAQKARCR